MKASKKDDSRKQPVVKNLKEKAQRSEVAAAEAQSMPVVATAAPQPATANNIIDDIFKDTVTDDMYSY